MFEDHQSSRCLADRFLELRQSEYPKNCLLPFLEAERSPLSVGSLPHQAFANGEPILLVLGELGINLPYGDAPVVRTEKIKAKMSKKVARNNVDYVIDSSERLRRTRYPNAPRPCWMRGRFTWKVSRPLSPPFPLREVSHRDCTLT